MRCRMTLREDDMMDHTQKPTVPYTATRIANELYATAMGHAYHGNALYVAKGVPGVTDEDRAVLDRYLTGAQRGTDHVALQDIALRIQAFAEVPGAWYTVIGVWADGGTRFAASIKAQSPQDAERQVLDEYTPEDLSAITVAGVVLGIAQVVA